MTPRTLPCVVALALSLPAVTAEAVAADVLEGRIGSDLPGSSSVQAILDDYGATPIQLRRANPVR
jgi:hypothetical protein